MYRYTLPEKYQRNLKVSPEAHRLVKLCARQKGITTTEATYVLLRKAILGHEGSEMTLRYAQELENEAAISCHKRLSPSERLQKRGRALSR